MHRRERERQRAEIGGSKSADHRKQVALEPHGQRQSETRKDKEDREAGDEIPVGAFSGRLRTKKVSTKERNMEGDAPRYLTNKAVPHLVTLRYN